MINLANFQAMAARSADPTLRNPGFFESSAMPTVPGILPGVLTPLTLPKVTAKSQKAYAESVIKDYMTTSAQLQLNFAQFLGGGLIST